MKIFPNIAVPNILQRPAFGSAKLESKPDSFDLSDNTKKVTIKNLEGDAVSATITETTPEDSIWDGEKIFSLYTKEGRLGYAQVRDDDYRGNAEKSLFLHRLETQEHKDRSYKGAGSALLACVTDECFNKRGYEKLKLNASHGGAAPLVFYYKNNLVIPQDDLFYPERYNAMAEYIVRHNEAHKDAPLAVENMIDPACTSFSMVLDKTGADAFLKGKRLHKTRKFEALLEDRKIGRHTFSSQLVQSPYENEHILQIVNETAKRFKLTLSAALFVKDENGEKSLEVCGLEKPCRYDCEDMPLEAIEEARKRLGCKKVVYDKVSISALESTFKKYGIEPEQKPEEEDDPFF